MTELIIINGEVKNCEVLFECNSVDDLASFKMIREGVEVTPDNAPTFDIFDIKLIAEPRSPYGFSSLLREMKILMNGSIWVLDIVGLVVL